MIYKRYKSVIFDLDGVIIDSSQVMQVAFEYAYQQFFPKQRAPFSEYVKHMGKGFLSIMDAMNLPREMYPFFNQKSIELISEIVVFDGIVPILERLKEQDCYVGIATGKDAYRTKQILDEKKLSSYFDCVICSDQVKRGKPYSDSVDIQVNQAGLDRDDLVFIGDSTSDIQCAKNASVSSIAVLWGMGSRADLLKENPDYFAYDPRDLEFILCDGWLQERVNVA